MRLAVKKAARTAEQLLLLAAPHTWAAAVVPSLLSAVLAYADTKRLDLPMAALVLLAGVVWTWTLRRCEPHRGAAPVPVRTTPAASRDTAKEAFVKSGFIFILLLTLYMGFLKDGIQTWVPKAITDIFGTTPALSVFLTAALPLINTIGVFAVKLFFFFYKD